MLIHFSMTHPISSPIGPMFPPVQASKSRCFYRMTQGSGTNQPAYYSQFDHVWPLEILSIVGRF